MQSIKRTEGEAKALIVLPSLIWVVAPPSQLILLVLIHHLYPSSSTHVVLPLAKQRLLHRKHMWTVQLDGSFIKIDLIFRDISNLCLSDHKPHFIEWIRCPLLSAIRGLENEARTGIRERSQPANGRWDEIDYHNIHYSSATKLSSRI